MTNKIERVLVKDISLLGETYTLYKRGDLLEKKPMHEYEKLPIFMLAEEWGFQLTKKGQTLKKILSKGTTRESIMLK